MTNDPYFITMRERARWFGPVWPGSNRPQVLSEPERMYEELRVRAGYSQEAEEAARRAPNWDFRGWSELMARAAEYRPAPEELDAIIAAVLARKDDRGWVDRHADILSILALRAEVSPALLDEVAALPEFFHQSTVDTAVSQNPNVWSSTLLRIVEGRGWRIYWDTVRWLSRNPNVTEEVLLRVLEHTEEIFREKSHLREYQIIWQSVAGSPKATAKVLGKVVDVAPGYAWREALLLPDTSSETLGKIYAYLVEEWPARQEYQALSGWDLDRLATHPNASEEAVLFALACSGFEFQPKVAASILKLSSSGGRRFSSGLLLAARMAASSNCRWRGLDDVYLLVDDLLPARAAPAAP